MKVYATALYEYSNIDLIEDMEHLYELNDLAKTTKELIPLFEKYVITICNRFRRDLRINKRVSPCLSKDKTKVLVFIFDIKSEDNIIRELEQDEDGRYYVEVEN
jgi:thioredoxin-related protein